MSDLRRRLNLVLVESLGPGELPAPDLDAAAWEALWINARDHCLVPYLHQRWLESGQMQTLPPDMARRFSIARQNNTERSRRMLLLLDELVCALQERGFAALVSKGLPLAQTYYGDLGLRVLYDIDLFVRENEFDQAFDVLRGLGYEPFSPERSHEPGRPLWKPAEYSWNAETVFDPDSPVLVELHTRPWQPHWHGFRIESGMDLWQGERVVDIAGRTLRVPAEERLLVHLAVHFACNVLECTARLMHLLDIVLILRQHGPGLDWKAIVKIIDENSLEPFCFIAFELASRTGGWILPQEVRSRLRDATPSRIVGWLQSGAIQDICSMGLRNRDRSLIYFLHWNTAGTWQDKAGVLLHSVRGPWLESTGPGRWRSLAARMGGRLQHLARTARGR